MARYFSIRVRSDRPEVLIGLEQWLQLGLVDGETVLQIAAEHLRSPLPETPEVRATPEPLPQGAALTVAPERRPVLPQVWQALRDNFSVLWLLAAGVFLIVAASTGLAITQWQTLPTVLQYGLLWVYTLGFAGASLWMARQERLVSTARALRILTGLLVPVNFWAMASFELSTLGEIGWLAIALGTLTAVGWLLVGKIPAPWLYLGASAIHWLWPQPLWVGLALYGCLAIVAIVQEIQRRPSPRWAFYALGLVLARGLATATLPTDDLGLGLGIWGWLLGRDRQRSGPLLAGGDALAGVLLLWGAILTPGGQLPWQVTLLTLLALELCGRRLRQSQRGSDILLTFWVGALAYTLAWQWLPSAWQTAVGLSAARWLELPAPQPSGLVWLLAFVPYVFLFLGGLLLLRLPRRLLRLGDGTAILVAATAAAANSGLPGPRSLGLTLLCGLLAWIGSRWSSAGLLGIAHGVGLLALGAGLDWKIPLSPRDWLVATTVCAAAEWGAGLLGDSWRGRGLGPLALRQGWLFGYGLAGLGYALVAVPLLWGTSWAAVWTVLPLLLAGITTIARPARRRQVATLSTVALGFAIGSVWGVPLARRIVLGLATLVMVANGRCWRRPWIAAAHIGYGLLWVGTLLVPLAEGSDWLVVAAIALWLLWLGGKRLARHYARATAGWAIALAAGLTIVLGLHALAFYSFGRLGAATPWQLPASAGLLGAAAVAWYRRQTGMGAALVLGGGLGLFLAEGVAFAGGDAIALAVGSMALGWGLLYLGRRGDREQLAIGFALQAFVLHFADFSAYSALITASVAGIVLVAGARRSAKGLTYIALGGISVAVAEGVLFWGRQLEGNLLPVFAAAATLLAVAYGTIARFWPQTPQGNLTRRDFHNAAIAHWLAGSGLFGVGLCLGFVLPGYPLSPWSSSVGAVLALWAWERGRDRGTVWVELGWLDLVGALIVARVGVPALQAWDPWWAALAGGTAAAIAACPWPHWGWQDRRPWDRVAMVLPALAVCLSWEAIAIGSVWIVALHYGWLAWRQRSWRWSYASLPFLVWGSWQMLGRLDLLGLMAVASLASGLAVYIAQVDPGLRRADRRGWRHGWRCGGCLPLCATAAIAYGNPGLVPAIVGLGFSLAGLTLRVRAFLLAGTLTLAWTVVERSLSLSQEYAFARWSIAFSFGMLFLIVYGVFESRRGKRLVAALQTWWQELQHWE